MKIDKRKFIIIFILIVFFINLFFPISTYAFISSVDACASQTNCAKGLSASLNIAENVVKSSVKNSASSLVVNAVNTTTGVAKTTLLTNVVGGLTIAAAGYTVGYLSVDKIEALQRKGLAEFCASNSKKCESFINNFTKLSGEFSAYKVYDDGASITVDYYKSDSNLTTWNYTFGNSSFVFAYAEPHPFGGSTLVKYFNITAWEGLSGDDRKSIVENFSDSELIDAIEVVGLEVPDVDVGEKLLIETDYLIEEEEVIVAPPFIIPKPKEGDDDDNKNAPPPNTSPGEDGNQSSSPSPGEDGNQSPAPGGGNGQGNSEGEGSSESEEKVISGGGGGGSGSEVEIEKEEIEEEIKEEQIVPPEISELPPVEFEQKNWLQHGIDVFSNKFPFDIFGEIPDSGEGYECPTYIFFDKSFELCIISDFIMLLKYPVIISFTLKMFHSL